MFSNDVYERIKHGKIAVVHNFLPKHEVRALQRDAGNLHQEGHFSTDALASYGKSGEFDPSKDRAVLKLAQWKNSDLGDWDTRQAFARRMKDMRADLSQQLQRPKLVTGDSVTKYGEGSTEISYTRFGPGAYLARHVDEHHEECKGVAGWQKPTRRSMTWLIYLNEDWNTDKNGGCLRCFERKATPSGTVGARRDGDLQVGWLRPTDSDPVEYPVFMDAQRAQDGSAGVKIGSGNCAMYIDDPSGVPGAIQYISNDFYANPTLFVAGSELIVRKTLLTRRDWQERFHLIEPPKSKLTSMLKSDGRHKDNEVSMDIEPTGGTLVLFDSVTLPHEVLATVGKDRWASSGWFHEDQQPVETHPHFFSS